MVALGGFAAIIAAIALVVVHSRGMKPVPRTLFVIICGPIAATIIGSLYGLTARYEGGVIAAAVTMAALASLFTFAKRAAARRAAGVRKRHEFFAALEAHIGRPHDSLWHTRYRRGRWCLVVWIAERTFYFSKADTPFDHSHFYRVGDIREWTIHRTRQLRDDRYWDSYEVNIVVKDLKNPLIKIYCGQDEATAYKINESFNQMFGEQLA